MQHLRRWLRRIGIGIAAAGLAWVVVMEAIEPHLLLKLTDIFGGGARPLEVPAVGGTTLRLYADTRPHIGKIAGLQKGLVWSANGTELIEEGYGFGCPIVWYDGRGYVSRHAAIESIPTERGVRLVKRFSMDTVDRPTRLLRRKYSPVPALGVVEMAYELSGDVIEVEADFSGVTVPWSQAYLMNEQGACTFTRYIAPNGSVRSTPEIGIWQDVEGHTAAFANDSGTIEFRVEAEGDVKLLYGRERYNQYCWRGVLYLSWSGVDIELSTRVPSYRYRVILTRLER